MFDKEDRLDQNITDSKTDSIDPDSDRTRIAILSEEYLSRLRAGENVSIQEYTTSYPELSSRIETLFPTIAAMEHLHSEKNQTSFREAPFLPGDSIPGNSSDLDKIGDYRIIGEIARGGMGIVYEAQQTSLGRSVAIKVMPQRMISGQRAILRFQREAQTAASLHHSNIVPIFGTGQHNGMLYIVMQLIKGVGLDEVIHQVKKTIFKATDHPSMGSSFRSTCIQNMASTLLESNFFRKSNASFSAAVNDPFQKHDQSSQKSQHNLNDPLTSSSSSKSRLPRHQIDSVVGKEYYQNVAQIGLQAAEALTYAHRHETLHRDIKPGNLILDTEGVIWMADFGLAKAAEQDRVTESKDIVGTIAYMAPERFSGETTEKSDIYSLGITLYELAAFSRPFDSENKAEIMSKIVNGPAPSPKLFNPSVPKDLETIILKSISINPKDRYPSAESFANDLRNFLNDLPIAARRLSKPQQFVRWSLRNPIISSLGLSVFLLATAIMAISINGYFHARQQQKRLQETTLLAVGAVDEIYEQLAPTHLRPLPASSSGLEEETNPLPRYPVASPEIAAVLENLLNFYDELSKKSASSDLFLKKSIVAFRKVGDIRRRLGEFDKSKKAYLQAIKRIESLRPAEKNSVEMVLESAKAQNGLGIALNESREFESAWNAHCLAVSQLYQVDSVTPVKYELARSLYYRSETLAAGNKKDPRQKTKDLVSAIALLTNLRTVHNTFPEYDILLARCMMAFPEDDSFQRSKRTAIAIEILENLIRRFPETSEYQYENANTYLMLFWRSKGRNAKEKNQTDEDLQESLNRIKKGIALAEKLVIKHPKNWQYQKLNRNLLYALGSIQLKNGQFAHAERSFAQASSLHELLFRTHPNSIFEQYWNLKLVFYRAVSLNLDKKKQKAMVLFESIVDQYDRFLTKHESFEKKSLLTKVRNQKEQTVQNLARIYKELGFKQKSIQIKRRHE